MPRRQKFTPVETLILLAILGILASIALPAMQQARRRAYAVRQPAREHFRPHRLPADGQLNTIEVSELSQSTRPATPGRWLATVVSLIPIIVVASFVFFIYRRIREQMARRA